MSSPTVLTGFYGEDVFKLALKSEVLGLGGNATITGTVTFAANPVFNAAAIPDAALSANVDLLNAQQTITGLKTFTVPVTGQAFAVTGLTGAQTASRLVGSTLGGPPTSGTFSIGDWVRDRVNQEWLCNNYVYPAQVRLNGASGYWALSETSGTTAVDQVAGANGTLNGGVTLGVAGPNSDGLTAMTFNGTTGYIDLGTSPVCTFGQPFTAGIIAKFGVGGGGAQVLYGCTDSTGSNTNFMFQYYAPLHRMGFTAHGSEAQIADGSVDDGLWHWWVGTYDGGKTGNANSVRIFRDGVLVASNSSPTVAVTSNLVTQIGRMNATAGRYFNGTAAAPWAIPGIQLSVYDIKRQFYKRNASFFYNFVSTTPATPRWANVLGPVFNVSDYGVVGDGRIVTDAAITSGTAVVTSSSANFTPADITNLREMCIVGAGAAGGVLRGMLIAPFISATSANLDTNAGATVTNAYATIGADNAASYQVAIRACGAAGGGTVYRPAASGLYLLNADNFTGANGHYNLTLNYSNIRFLADGASAVLQQGPVSPANCKMLMVNGGADSALAASTQYGFNAAKRGDYTLTMTTASDASHWVVGDVIYIRSSPSVDSGQYAELNIVTSVNAGTGVLGLQWALGKPYGQNAPYGASVATSLVLRNISFENEYWRSLCIGIAGGGTIDLVLKDCNFDQSNVIGTATGSSLISPGFIRGWQLRSSAFAYDVSGTQVAQGCDDFLMQGSRVVQRGGASGWTIASENVSNARVTASSFWSVGSSDNTKAMVQVGNSWGCQLESSTLIVNSTANPAGMLALSALPGNQQANDLVVRNNIIWGGSSIKAPNAKVDGNVVRYNGTAQAIISQGPAQLSVTNNNIYLSLNSSTGIYYNGDGTTDAAYIVGNKIFGDSTAGQVGIYLQDDGAGVTKGPTVIDNFGTGLATGLTVQNTAHEPGILIRNNDFSGCTTPYNPTTLANLVLQTGDLVISAGKLGITSSDANALAVGPAGTTNPSLQIDASTASSVTGLKVKAAGTGAGLALSVISSNANEAMTLDAKGTSGITIAGTSTGGITLGQDVTFAKHLISTASGTPTTSALGANVTSATFTGNDTRGTIAIVMAGALAANTKVCTCTFAVSYGATAPKVTLVDQTSAVGLTIVNSYVLSQSTGVSFDIAFDQALAAGTYTVDYICIG